MVSNTSGLELSRCISDIATKFKEASDVFVGCVLKVNNEDSVPEVILTL